MRDEITVAVDRLTDGQLDELARTYERFAAVGDFPEWGRRWYSDLAASIRQRQQGRAIEWLCILDDPAVPPSWDVAVAALPADNGEMS
jgi:hypothetical protein